MDTVIKNLINIGKKYNVEKVILFGSRARKDNSNNSDYDIAIISK